MMYLLFYMDRVNISSLAPLISKELELSAFDIGLVFSAFAYPYALFQIIGGYVGDRLGGGQSGRRPGVWPDDGCGDP